MRFGTFSWGRLLTPVLCGMSMLVLGLLTTPAVAADRAADALWLDRLTWGATPQDLAELQSMGRASWLAKQLHPGPVQRLAAPVQSAIDAMTVTQQPIDQIVANLERLLAEKHELKASGAKGPKRRNKGADSDSMAMSGSASGPDTFERDHAYNLELGRLKDEASVRSLLRAMYAPDQLREQMTWFWYNHFNVFSHGHIKPGLLGDYEDRAIRAHALGKFRDLLGAVVTHPAMLVYLNADKNTAGHINENLARELMELHTLGIDGGYTQADVQSLAAVLTGLGMSGKGPNGKHNQDAPGRRSFVQGVSEFSPARHEAGAKQFLGHPVQGRGWDEIEQTLDVLAHHPATAHHVSYKLAQYFVADEPSKGLVDRLAKKFLDSDGDIPAVLSVLFDSPEFTASLDHKFKDPMHYLVSSMRLSFPEPREIPEPEVMLKWLKEMGQPLYGRVTPDGYPLVAAEWNASGQMAARFEVARNIGLGAPKLFNADGEAGHRRAGVPPLNGPYFREAIAPTLGANTLAALKDTHGPAEWNAVLLSSPEFMTR